MVDGYDPERSREALVGAVSCAFADMAFMDVAPFGDASGGSTGGSTGAASADTGSGREVRAAIDMLKPVSGRLELRMPEELRARILDTLYGGAEEPAGERRDDTVLELLNVVAGQFLSRYFGSGAGVKLELPQYLYFHEGYEGEAVLDLAFDAEGLPVRALLSSVRYRY